MSTELPLEIRRATQSQLILENKAASFRLAQSGRALVKIGLKDRAEQLAKDLENQDAYVEELEKQLSELT